MKNATARAQVRFRNILFATDFSPAAAHAIPHVKRITAHYDADLVTLYVRPPVVNPMTPPGTWATGIEVAKDEDDRHREEVLHTFAGIRTQVLIEEGGIQACLAAAIKNYNTDLVVIGTRGRNGLGKLLLGSVAEEIFRTISCPVLTVGPHSDPTREPSGELRQILYATDLSPEARGGVGYALSLAEEFQSRLILLHVIPGQEPGDLVSPANVKPALEELLRELVPADVEARYKPEFFVECGDPAEKILEFAHQRETDLVVLGVRPEKGPDGAATHLPNAIAHKVVSHAECPVLTVRH